MVTRTIRRSQTVMPFGPGAIYGFGDESFIAMDSSRWTICNTIHLERLEKVLNVSEFREPAAALPFSRPNPNYSVPFMRFPSWNFCPKCRRMKKINRDDEFNFNGKVPICQICGSSSKLAPMRFIAVCSDGHIQDVNWGKWAHSANNKDKNVNCTYGTHDLRFVSDASTNDILIRCNYCKAFRSLTKGLAITSKDSMLQIGESCSGRQPWQSHDRAINCAKPLSIIQRADSNAYFSDVLSALDISSDVEDPNEEIKAAIINHVLFPAISQLPNELKAALINQLAAQVPGATIAIIMSCLGHDDISQDFDKSEVKNEDPTIALKVQEWASFTAATTELQGKRFVVQKIDMHLDVPAHEMPIWNEFRRLVKSVILARKIRIVKALTGFRRLDPEGNKITPHLNGDLRWLPATEIYGEGIFIELNQTEVKKWVEKLPPNVLFQMREKQINSKLGRKIQEAKPDFVMLHTLSHLLIRQLTFECGYSSSSLAERIYSNDEMSGILIYTGSSDSEGAMGGLVREGEVDRIYSIFKTALFRGQWCSSDPICSELPYQGYAGMNKAACHACALLAETSCEAANSLLDRGMIYGSSITGGNGYFSEMMKLIVE